ncbi:hypothetical protein [Almyronema epifaneia]|uniref:Uncharacterized protein n=1 Tax=Almyronema epifaneia S1 TaxID=2991925 RepID=A0ABW6IFC1_9CYAN
MVSSFLNEHSFSLLVSAGSIFICTCACWIMAYRLSQAYSQR